MFFLKFRPLPYTPNIPHFDLIWRNRVRLDYYFYPYKQKPTPFTPSKGRYSRLELGDLSRHCWYLGSREVEIQKLSFDSFPICGPKNVIPRR